MHVEAYVHKYLRNVFSICEYNHIIGYYGELMNIASASYKWLSLVT